MGKPYDLVLLIIFSHLLGTDLAICQPKVTTSRTSVQLAPTNNQRGQLFINGFPCKDPGNITASDINSMALLTAVETDNILGSFTSTANATEYLGLNTLGLSIGRTDLDVFLRFSEIIFVMKGEIVAGFIDTHNKVFEKVVERGNVCLVLPKGIDAFHLQLWACVGHYVLCV